ILKNLLALRSDGFDARKVVIEDVIAPKAMGDHNSIYDLQNYVVGLSPAGLTLREDGTLDTQKSFVTVDYLQLLASQRVRNNVQAKLSDRPIDFVALR